MRVVVKEYAEGGRGAFELCDDGSLTIGEWSGPRKVGARICAFVETACEDTEANYTLILETLAWLGEEIKKRKANPVEV